MMKKLLLCTFLLGLLTTTAFSQTDRFWVANNSNSSRIATDKAVSRLSFPKTFKLFNLNFDAFKNEAFSIVDGKSAGKATVITLPNADGQLEQFEIYEASNFEPALQAKFPEIRAYSGRGISDKYATLKLSVSPKGIQTMVFRTDKDNEFMEPYSADHTVYAVYKGQREKGSMPWNCSTEDKVTFTGLGNKINPMNLTNRSTGDLKTMRLAQSVTAEYSNYFGATNASQVGLVLAAINATLTRCNGIYEKDLALHLNLIANDTAVIYYTPSTDPYDAASTGAGGTWNGQLQSTLTSVIGSANYDIGHLFGASGGGGNAGCIGCICTNPTASVPKAKGSGYTSPADGIPEGDNFDIDYVTHEVGHQLGANHTFSHSSEGTGVNKEPGSGITIMGYAGITSYDLAGHSFDFYHQASINQVQTNLASVTCPVTTTIVNATPVLAPVSNYTIPKSTPFALTGSATDADNDALTYCWEQDDNTTTTGANSIARTTKATGPNWISFKPTASPTRLFPRLQSILAGKDTTGALPGGGSAVRIEALSSVARTLKFRLTVRDNHVFSSTAPVDAAQTQYTDMTVTVNAAAGPFLVTSPNTPVTWTAGTCQTITWSVNNTNVAPINCANVDVELSTDGGQTFPIMLASNVPNNGSAQVSIPQSINTTQGRIRVSAVGNIFFDIDNANISITPANYPQFAMCTPAAAALCENGTANVVINTNALGGFTAPITFTASGNPAGSTITFSPNPAMPGDPVTVTFQGASLSGNYTVAVTGVADTVTRTVNTTFNVVGTAAIPVLNTPANNSTGVSPLPTYNWFASPGVTGYLLEVSDTSTFSPVLRSYTVVGNSFTTPATDALLEDKEYFWRVTPTNICGTGPTSVGNRFKTYKSVCSPAEYSPNVPKTINASGTPIVTSTMTVAASGSIVDVDVVGLKATHSWIADLGIQLRHGTGVATLLNYACDNNTQYQDLDINYDDEATSATVPCPPTDGLYYKPVTPLSVFDNTSSTGTWTLRIKDTANQDGGSLTAWGLRVCTIVSSSLPVNWTAFTGNVVENKTVALKWSTANEVNNNYYEVERSSNGVTYTTIGTIKAGNNPTGVQNYFFNDLKPFSGVNYYRLKQVDKDSKFEYSKVVKVVIEKASTMFTMYPNPTRENSTVRMMKDVKELKLRLTDGLGRVVYFKTIGIAKAGEEFTIPVKDFSRGVYVLTVATDNETQNKKVVAE